MQEILCWSSFFCLFLHQRPDYPFTNILHSSKTPQFCPHHSRRATCKNSYWIFNISWGKRSAMVKMWGRKFQKLRHVIQTFHFWFHISKGSKFCSSCCQSTTRIAMLHMLGEGKNSFHWKLFGWNLRVFNQHSTLMMHEFLFEDQLKFNLWSGGLHFHSKFSSLFSLWIMRGWKAEMRSKRIQMRHEMACG